MVLSLRASLVPAMLLMAAGILAQRENKGRFSGSFDANVNFFVEDEKIGATNTPQYDDDLIGIESWLNLRYAKGPFDAGIRLDFFRNSNLLNPTDAYSDTGIGRVYATYRHSGATITAGHMYDQIGSGMIFRAYEERALLLDNALLGLRMRYDISDNWNVNMLGGRQKNLFSLYDSWLYGGRVEGYITPKSEDKTWSAAPGFGLMIRRLAEDQMDLLANVLSSYTPEDFIDEAPYVNVAATLYNTFDFGTVSWYLEGAWKSREVFYDPLMPRSLWTGGESIGRYILEPGYVVYTSINYADKGIGVSLDLKATSNFTYRADPFATLNRGMINFLPPVMRFNTYRLTARYAPATQELGEFAGQIEASYRLDANRSFLTNVSMIHDYEGNPLYRELYTEAVWKKPRKSSLTTGLQFQWYHQERYEGKTGAAPVRTVTPYIDYLYRFDQKRSFRIEFQYMHTRQDWGRWLYGLAEFSIAPHWNFEISDMWNVKPYEDASGNRKNDPLHFPTAGITYITGTHRITGRYVKQVEGIVCSGGICRLEPAFSGVRLQLASQF